MAQISNTLDPVNVLGVIVSLGAVAAANSASVSASSPTLASALWLGGLLGGMLFIAFHFGKIAAWPVLARLLIIGAGAVAIGVMFVVSPAPSAPVAASALTPAHGSAVAGKIPG